MFRKLFQLRIWGRIYTERLGEPFLYNLVSFFVFLFGNIVTKIKYDLVPRQPYAFGLGEAFRVASEQSSSLGIERIVIVEFGVASGAGLLNLVKISEKLSRYYNLQVLVVGFDSGEGMPHPVDYRDHPEKYLDGDFPPHDRKLLDETLPSNAVVIYGPIAECVGKLDGMLTDGDFISFISIDVDYWSSTNDCLKIFDNMSLKFLPSLPMYFDDVNNIDHHPYAGELLSIQEYNDRSSDKKIVKMNQLRNWRLFKNALWLDQMYWFYDLQSRFFTRDFHTSRKRIKLGNPYLGQGVEDVVEKNLPPIKHVR
jgi:hypothetical protein